MAASLSSRVVMCLAAGTLAVTAAVGVTSAHASRIVRIASHISIRGHGRSFTGKVRSPNQGCLPRRRVTLHRANGQIVGSTRTDPYGHWKIRLAQSAHGGYYARVGRSSQGAAGTIYVCRGARSRALFYH